MPPSSSTHGPEDRPGPVAAAWEPLLDLLVQSSQDGRTWIFVHGHRLPVYWNNAGELVRFARALERLAGIAQRELARIGLETTGSEPEDQIQ